MPTTPSQLVAAFLQAFMSGEIDRASSMVSEDFSFRAPLQRRHKSGATYPARKRNPDICFINAFRILRQWTDGEEVSTVL